MKFTFTPESRPLPGFTLKRAIYRGGFGEVYYGISDAGREVALKLLQHNTEVELRGVQQCLNLSHPNLVTIFDVRQDHDGDHWIVMEYVAGETLDSAIRRHPKGMPVETILKWLPGIVSGVSYLHRSGLVHRDLKPGNLFIENDIVKVGDVGLSKFISPSRQSAHTQSVGTVYYMAPEVAKGRYGKAVDLYALGVILYEMLTGDLPFDGESTGEILMKHLTEQPDLSRLPARVRPVIAKALQKNPQDRYSTLEELQAAFEEAVVGKPIADKARPSEPFTPQAKVLQKKPRCGKGWKTSGHSCCPKWPGFHPWGVLLVVAGFIAVRHAHHHFRWFPIVLVASIGYLMAHNVWAARARNNGQKQKLATTLPLSRPGPAPIVGPQRSRRLGMACASSVAAFPFVLLLSSLLALLRPSLFTVAGAEKIDPGLIGFFIAVSMLATWGILLVPTVQGVPRKYLRFHWGFAMFGAVLGVASWKLQEYLFVQIPAFPEWRSTAVFHRLGDHPLMVGGMGPTLAGYLAFFTMFLGIRNWNALTSPWRNQRFAMGSVLMTLFLAWLTTRCFEFPIPWALAWGAVIACSVQLASPWGPQARPNFISHNR